MTPEMKQAPDHWVGFINDKPYELMVPEDIKNDPKSFYNSTEGIEFRKKSVEILKRIDEIRKL